MSLNVSKMCLWWLILILLCGNCSGYIFHLNASEYARMPPIFHLDPYDTCLQENNETGVYCSVQFDLITDDTSELYSMIKQYSEKTEVHFNHAKLSYGICLTKTCKKFYQRNITEDRVVTLEACLNHTMWEKYKLKTRVGKKISCENQAKVMDINNYDVIVAVLLAIIFLLNLVGSLQEVYFGMTGRGNSVLFCFSISRNWRKLVAPEGENQFAGFYGIKTISIMLVIMFHSMVPYVVNLENTQYFEEGYNKWHYQIVANGTLVVQSFFVMSGFLISYNVESHVNKTNWLSVPQAIIRRWMRLTPPYLVMLAVTATWMRYFGSGPLWQMAVISEVEDCQQNWWYHLFYINNYIDYSQCMIPAWYIAADFQLFCVGVLVCILTSEQKRKLILALLFIIGLMTPAVHTYLQDLNGVFLITPEGARNFFVLDPTFNNSYKRGHTNLASFVIGLTVGLLVYHWQSTSHKLHRFLRHRYTFWMTLPIPFCLILLGSIFYRDAPRDSVYIRMMYAAFSRPLWGIWLGYFIIGIVFRFEATYRALLEWYGWTAPSRVSYCAYLLHLLLIRVSTGTMRSVMHLSMFHLLETVTSTIIISFLAAVPFHLIVEAPFLQLIKLSTSGPRNNVTNQREVEKSNNVLNIISSDEDANKVLDDGAVRVIDSIEIKTQIQDASKEIVL